MRTSGTGAISILLPDLRGGGAERVMLYLAKEFLARGLSVEFVLMRADGELLPLLPEGARLVHLKASRIRNALLPLASYLRQKRPEALLAVMWPLTSIAIWARDLTRVPTRVITCEQVDFRMAPPGDSALGRLKLRQTMRWSYPRAHGVVAVSTGAATTVAAFANLPPQVVSVIHNPVEPPNAQVLAAGVAAPAWAHHDGPKLIAIGTLKEQKRFSVLLAAFAKVRQHSRARLLILGEGPQRGELEELRGRLGLDGAVDMPGFVRDPYPYLAMADLFVLSSAWEGLPLVLIEALASGTPVVCTDCPSGPREILEDGRYGRLVPVGDVNALAKAVMASLHEGHDREVLIHRSKDFSVQHATDQYLRVLFPGASEARRN